MRFYLVVVLILMIIQHKIPERFDFWIIIIKIFASAGMLLCGSRLIAGLGLIMIIYLIGRIIRNDGWNFHPLAQKAFQYIVFGGTLLLTFL